MTGRQISVVKERQTGKMAGRNKGRQDSNRQTSARKKDRQARQLQTKLEGGTVIEKWEQTTDWQFDRQTNRQMDRMTNRRTSARKFFDRLEIRNILLWLT